MVELTCEEVRSISQNRFKSYLAALKELKGVSCYQIEKDCHIRSGTLYNYRNGKRDFMPLDVITKISVYYDFPYNY